MTPKRRISRRRKTGLYMHTFAGFYRFPIVFTPIILFSRYFFPSLPSCLPHFAFLLFLSCLLFVLSIVLISISFSFVLLQITFLLLVPLTMHKFFLTSFMFSFPPTHCTYTILSLTFSFSLSSCCYFFIFFYRVHFPSRFLSF